MHVRAVYGVHSPHLTRGDFVGGRAKLVPLFLTGVVEEALESIMFVSRVVSADNACYKTQLNEINNYYFLIRNGSQAFLICLKNIYLTTPIEGMQNIYTILILKLPRL